MTNEQRKAYITALLDERRGYEARGLAEKVAAVDDELRRVGFDAGPPAKRSEKRVTRGR